MIHALPGFLGSPSDWDHLKSSLRSARSTLDFRAYDLLAKLASAPDLNSLARALNQEILSRDPRPVLIGYSLGARVALHQLLLMPKAFAGAVLVSASTGLATASDQVARVESDERWARRFESEDRRLVLKNWQAQSVFLGTPARVRSCSGLVDRESTDLQGWGQSLRQWGQGRQARLEGRLAEIGCPVLWVAGGDDPRYVEMARAATRLNARFTLEIVNGCAHRVPWENPEHFSSSVLTFIQKLF